MYTSAEYYQEIKKPLKIIRAGLVATSLPLGAFALVTNTESSKDSIIADTLKEFGQTDSAARYENKAHEEAIQRNGLFGFFIAGMSGVGLSFIPGMVEAADERKRQHSEALRNI